VRGVAVVLTSGSFVPKTPQVLHWQRSLLVTGDVAVLLVDILRMWSYLEPLFLLSDEVSGREWCCVVSWCQMADPSVLSVVPHSFACLR
jgi:hypothetical protein